VSSHLKQEYLSQSHSFEESSIMESLPTTIKKNILIALSNAVKNNILFNHLTNSTQFQLVNYYYYYYYYYYYLTLIFASNIYLS
jgi:hypothetical protein